MTMGKHYMALNLHLVAVCFPLCISCVPKVMNTDFSCSTVGKLLSYAHKNEVTVKHDTCDTILSPILYLIIRNNF